MLLSRRGFLAGLGALIAAPAIEVVPAEAVPWLFEPRRRVWPSLAPWLPAVRVSIDGAPLVGIADAKVQPFFNHEFHLAGHYGIELPGRVWRAARQSVRIDVRWPDSLPSTSLIYDPSRVVPSDPFAGGIARLGSQAILPLVITRRIGIDDA